MKKVYAIVGLIIIAGIMAGVAIEFYMKPTLQTVTEDFEGGFGEWTADVDVPLDPNSPSQPVEWHVMRVSNISHSGQSSAELFIDGRQDDGTVWIERKIAVEKNLPVNVRISFWFYSEQESFNIIASVCAYAGVNNPEAEGDFAVVGPANEVVGWKNYAQTMDFNMASSGEFWVAVGISVRWEAYMTYYIDDVRIEIT